MARKKTEPEAVKPAGADIEARLARLESLLATPGKRGLDSMENDGAPITSAVRQAVLAEKARGRSMASMAEEAGLSRAHLTTFVNGKKDLNGASLDKLARLLMLKVVKME